MKILVTGGAGYIGSHTCVELIKNGYEVVIVDNFCNSSPLSIQAVCKITNTPVKYYQADIRDVAEIGRIMKEEKVEAVIHFAGLKAVGESVVNPLKYYDYNVYGSLCLIKAMENAGVSRIVFSSTASIYGSNPKESFDETDEERPENPYAQTKHTVESILKAYAHSNSNFHAIALRYFNAVGAHESGDIGEQPNGVPKNLVPFVANVASGEYEKLYVFGGDYNTKDGTCIRDYIHVSDLAQAHVKAVQYIDNAGYELFNVGTGKGNSVLDIINCFSRVCKKEIAYEITDRREGDPVFSVANTSKAKKLLGFEYKYDIEKMCEDTWRWKTKHPKGYERN